MAFLAKAGYRAVKRLFKRKPKKTAPKKKRTIRGAVCNGVIQVCKTKQEDRDFVNCNTIESGTYTFELNDFPTYASYVALYEYYRIDKVQLTWRTMNNVSRTGVISTGSDLFVTAGRIHSVIDYNDSSAPAASRAGIQTMMQDESYKCTSSFKNHTRTLVPKILIEGGGSSVGVLSKGKQWIPTGATTASLTHYAVKYIMEGGFQSGASTSYGSFMVEPTIKLWVSFKNPQ